MAVKCDKKNITLWFCHFKSDTLSQTFFAPFIIFSPFFHAKNNNSNNNNAFLGPLSFAHGQKRTRQDQNRFKQITKINKNCSIKEYFAMYSYVSDVSNKRRATFILFEEIFQALRSYSRPYVYSFYLFLKSLLLISLMPARSITILIGFIHDIYFGTINVSILQPFNLHTHLYSKQNCIKNINWQGYKRSNQRCMLLIFSNLFSCIR